MENLQGVPARHEVQHVVRDRHRLAVPIDRAVTDVVAHVVQRGALLAVDTECTASAWLK